MTDVTCGLCGADAAFTGTCGGGRNNPKALCYGGLTDVKLEAVAHMNQHGVIHEADYEWFGLNNHLTPLCTLESAQQAVAVGTYELNAERMRQDARITALENALRQAVEALESQQNGLQWFRDNHPADVHGDCDEMDEQVNAAITAGKEALKNKA